MDEFHEVRLQVWSLPDCGVVARSQLIREQARLHRAKAALARERAQMLCVWATVSRERARRLHDQGNPVPPAPAWFSESFPV